MQVYSEEDQVCISDPDLWSGKTFPGHSPAENRKERTSGSSSKKSWEFSFIPYQFLDLTPGAGNLLGVFFWEILSPWHGGCWMRNTGASPSVAVASTLWQILEERPHPKYYLTRKACLGSIRRASERGKPLPAQLLAALEIQAGLRANGSPELIATSEDLLCLNDQGGQMMNTSVNITGTLRAQMHHHQPLLLESNQNHATVREDGVSTTLPASMGMGGGYVPMVYENHGIDARYNGPMEVVPTLSARCGTGGNNIPLVEDDPTLFSRQRVDVFQENDIVSTESARQHKDATDLVVQPFDQRVGINLIRRLTPLECERLQGFPDGWTNIPYASDSARYKALGNSVAIPCVEYVMQGIALVLKQESAEYRRRPSWHRVNIPWAA